MILKAHAIRLNFCKFAISLYFFFNIQAVLLSLNRVTELKEASETSVKKAINISNESELQQLKNFFELLSFSREQSTKISCPLRFSLKSMKIDKDRWKSMKIDTRNFLVDRFLIILSD